MINEIKIGNQLLKYELTYKRVKNINLRINHMGEIFVSANKRVSQKTIEDFIISKGDFVLRAIEKFKQTEQIEKHQYYTEAEVREIIADLCSRVYPIFENRGVRYPVIKFRKMVSQWGNCRSQKGVLTFNTNLMYAPIDCIEYVVCHEFTHFLQANHSKEFYNELSKIMPDWKIRREKIKRVSIR